MKQTATGSAEQAFAAMPMNDAGPEHKAPANPQFAGSFDEFAGVFGAEDAVLLAGRSTSDYARYKEAYEFGRRAATDKHFRNREWAGAADDLSTEWKQHGGSDQDRLWASVKRGWMEVRDRP